MHRFATGKILAILLTGVLSACGGGTVSTSTQATSSPPSSGGTPNPPPPSSPTNYTLQVSLAGSGSVSSNPAGITCGADCSQTYASGTSVTLSATPANGYNFSGWSGSGISCPGTGTCTVSMTASRTVTATFSQAAAANYTLTVTLAGSGSVSSNPAGISCASDCSESYATGTSVTLTATATNGYNFSGWSGSGISCPGTGTCTVSMTAARSVVASFTSATASGDLCDGLVTDKLAHPMTALAKPAVGQTVTDPAFGTTIRRITNVGGTGVIKPAYSTIPAWNADETYLILYHTGTSNSGHHLYHGKTYAYIRQLNIDPPDLEQFYWHTTDPDVLFYVDSSDRLIRYRVGSNTKEVVKTFTCGGSISGGADPMFMSWDSDVIGLRCSSGYVFTYRISTNSEGTQLSNGSGNAPVASASGTMTFFSNGSAEVRDNNMNYLRSLPVDPNEHASLGRLANGTDTHNAVSFGGSYEGSLVTSDMTQNNVARVIVGPDTGYPYPPGGTHVSAIAFKKPGWVALSIVGNTNGQTLLNQELVLADTNPGGKVCRVGHHRSWGKAGPRDYWAEPHVVISPSGTRLLFGSDWGGGTSVDAYVVELPSYRP